MYIPKRYGQSRVDNCPFCGKHAFTKNSQDIPVCKDHKGAILNDFKCACGSYLDLRTGKYGAYFNCMNCGNVNFKKALELNEVKDISGEQEKPQHSKVSQKIEKERPINPYRRNPYPSISSQKKEVTIRSDDPRYFD